MSADLSHRVARVGRDAVSEALFTVADSDDPLAVSIPCDVVDTSSDDVVFAFCGFRSDRVPDSHRARHIAGCDVEAAGGEACYCCLCCVCRVLLRD